MANIRLISATVIDSTHISARFTAKLNPQLQTTNTSIVSDTPGVESPVVLDIDVLSDTLTIRCQPLIAQASYVITFSSTDDAKFSSLNGDAALLNDPSSNTAYLLGPVEESNPVKDSIKNLFKNNVYQLEDGSTVSKYIDSISLALSKALYTIGQTKSDNYLSFLVKDELKTRGTGPFDRLSEEGAYEILRVGTNPTSSHFSGKIKVASFPDHLYSLLATPYSESLTTSNEDITRSFNLKTLTVNTSKSPVSKIVSITFIYNSILPPYKYDISTLGYQIKDSRYDPEFAFTYITLANNQFRLSSKVIGKTGFSLEDIASINIDYEFKNDGISIDPTSLSIFSTLPSGRENLPPLENIFNLAHAPILKANGLPALLGDVQFIDPNAIPTSNAHHPAFLYEIFFRFEQLPSRPGEYAVDYQTGNVYVYGQDSGQTGTGNYPPVASYYYQHIYQDEIDYVYEEDERELSALPNGNLTEAPVSIIYNYEQAFIKGTDYTAEVHKESLSERVENRITALNTIEPLNFPITNVFRIYNETSGEIYQLQRWTDTKVFFNYQTPPRIEHISGEKVSFDLVSNETLFVSSIINVSPTRQIYHINLENNAIIASSEDATARIGNSSVVFSELSTFNVERYWDSESSQSQNLSKLNSLGEYQIDYINGVIYVLVSSSQDLSIGTVSYRRGYIRSQKIHITSIQDIYFKFFTSAEKIRSLRYAEFSDSLILPSVFDKTDESHLTDTLPYQLANKLVSVFEDGYFVSGVKDYIKNLRGVFERQDLINSTTPINFISSATFNGKVITVNPVQHQEYHAVEHDGSGFFITAGTNLPYLSPQITRTITVKRLSDSVSLWNGAGTIEVGNPFKLRLPGINSPAIGQPVIITYSYEIQDLSRVIVDYSRGDYLIDYSYLADEILISYEYGDNVLNFAKSTSVEPGNNYYVSYRAGALRQALLQNFGTLIDIPILNNLNVDFERERYRDALMAAMQSFTKGPTLLSLRNIVESITHSPPEILESNSLNWALGSSILSPEKADITGNLQLLSGRHGTGVLISEANESLSFPVASNLKIEEGTLEMWITPQWNGIDNQADLVVSIAKDSDVISDRSIFIGPTEEHPKSLGGVFVINGDKEFPVGVPNKNKNGIYLYLDSDPSGLFNRWKVDVVDDGYSDGYDGYISTASYIVNIQTYGKFYDVKRDPSSLTVSGRITSSAHEINFKIPISSFVEEGITFTADYEHYLFDFGNSDPELNIGYTIKIPQFIENSEDYIISEDGEVLLSESGIPIIAESTLPEDLGDYIITESGETLITELGDLLIL